MSAHFIAHCKCMEYILIRKAPADYYEKFLNLTMKTIQHLESMAKILVQNTPITILTVNEAY